MQIFGQIVNTEIMQMWNHSPKTIIETNTLFKVKLTMRILCNTNKPKIISFEHTEHYSKINDK